MNFLFRLRCSRTLALLAALLLGLSSPAKAEEQSSSLPYDDALATDTSDWSALLEKGEFDALEKIADELRAKKSKYRNGRGRLWRFAWIGLGSNHRAMNEEGFAQSIKHLEAWLKAKPKSVNARLVLANLWEKYAHRAAEEENETDDVNSPQSATGRRAKATRYLDEIASLTKDVDNVYRRLRIELSKWMGQKPDVALVYEGLKADPASMELVHGMAICLLPRWFGDEGELEDFADEVVRRTKDSCGELQYVTAAIATKELLKDCLLDTHRFSWPRLQQGFRDIERLYPKSTEFLNDEAQLAFMAGDLKSVYALMSRIGDHPRQASWKEAEISFQGFRLRMTPEMLQGDQKQLLLGHVDAVMAAEPLGEQMVASVNWEFGIRMHDPATGDRRGWMWIRGIRADSVSIHPTTGLFAAGSEYDPGVMLQSFANGKSGALMPSAEKVKETAFSPKGDLLATADEQGLVVIFDLKTGKAKHEFAAQVKRDVTGLAFSSKATKLAATCGSGEVLIFDLSENKAEATHKVTEKGLRSVAWADRHLAVGTLAGEIHVLNSTTGAKFVTWKTDPLEIASLAFSPDSEKLAIGIRPQDWDTPVATPLLIWNFGNDNAPVPLKGHKLGVNSVRFMDQGKKLLSASHDWTVRVWDVP